MSAPFKPEWRRRKSAAFNLKKNSTGRGTLKVDLWGKLTDVYLNANFSVYSAQKCNARCRFCIEEVRPASRGTNLQTQKRFEEDDKLYFTALKESLDALKPLAPTISVTGGEPSLDPRLPQILQLISQYPAKRRTMTTNASGLLREMQGRQVLDWLPQGSLTHLNISRAHYDTDENNRLMRYTKSPDWQELAEITSRMKEQGIRVRLSCALIKSGVNKLNEIMTYLDYAQAAGVDNVIFRQLMLIDENKMAPGEEVLFSNAERVQLEPLLNQISQQRQFQFISQVMGYYYYVEVWHYKGIDVVFEEADLGRLEDTKKLMPGVVQELIFHPNAKLASTWQPWDGILGPL